MALVALQFPPQPDDAIQGKRGENQPKEESPDEVAGQDLVEGGIHCMVHPTTFRSAAEVRGSHRHHAVLFVQDDDAGLVARGLGGGIRGEAHHGKAVADLPEVGRGAVELDLPRARLAIDDVRLEPLAVAHVADEDFLVREEAGQLCEIGRWSCSLRNEGWPR